MLSIQVAAFRTEDQSHTCLLELSTLSATENDSQGRAGVLSSLRGLGQVPQALIHVLAEAAFPYGYVSSVRLVSSTIQCDLPYISFKIYIVPLLKKYKQDTRKSVIHHLASRPVTDIASSLILV